jgi:hypothetical protein
MDEVGCLLEATPPPCCAKYDKNNKANQRGLPQKVSRGDIKSAMSGIRDQTLECHAAHGGVGIVKLRVTVAPNGWATNVDISESPNADLGACIATLVRSAHFGASVDGLTFTYPWVFR